MLNLRQAFVHTQLQFIYNLRSEITDNLFLATLNLVVIIIVLSVFVISRDFSGKPKLHILEFHKKKDLSLEG